MTTTEAPSVVGEATVGELQAAVRGPVIRPGDTTTTRHVRSGTQRTTNIRR